MPRRERPLQTTRSEHWTRLAVNERAEALNGRIAGLFGWEDRIEWFSPVVSDSYAEYRDEAFLERLGISDPAIPLRAFWPQRGPSWDALGKTDSGRIILIEAKAYVEEAVDYRSRALGNSLERIHAALTQAKGAFAATPDASWTMPFYQYANRLAHLYYLRRLNGFEAYLVFLYFANAPDVPVPATIEEWRGAERVIKKSLGLSMNHPFSNCIGTLIWDVDDMLNDGRGAD
jgi:hypothetical protein